MATGVGMTRTAAMLALFGALRWAKRHDIPSQWSDADWRRLVAGLKPREIAIIALHGIRGMEQPRVVEWLDDGFGRQTVSNLYRQALKKLSQNPMLE
jgi:hypothetical protein